MSAASLSSSYSSSHEPSHLTPCHEDDQVEKHLANEMLA
jgi:hypothetical protein